MKKKLFSFILAICLIVPFAFLLTACGGNNPPNNGNQQYLDFMNISKNEWELNISTNNNFYVFTETFIEGEKGKLESITDWCYKYIDGELIRHTGVSKNGMSEYVTYSKDTSNSAKYYCEQVKYRSSKYDNSYNDGVTLKYEIDEQTYNENVYPLLDLIDFIGSNYSKFNHTETGDLISLDDLNNTNYAKNLGITQLSVYRNSSISFNDCYNIEVIYYINDVMYRIWFYESTMQIGRAFSNLNNYTIKGGTSTDYGEYTFTQNGLKIYTPYQQDATQREAYYKFDKDTNKYIVYRQDSDGNWSISETTDTLYNSVVDGLDKLYLSFKEHLDTFYLTDNGYKSLLTFYETELNYMNSMKLVYSKILIPVDNSGNITGGEFTFKIKQGIAESEDYNIQIVTNQTIDFPTVGTHSHNFAESWSSNDVYHWHTCEDSTCVDNSDKAMHDFDDGTIVTEATSTKQGSIKYTCQTCGKEVTKKYTKLIDKNYTPASNETQWKNILNIYERATSSHYKKYIDESLVFHFNYYTSDNSISIYDYNTSTDAVYQIVNNEYKKNGKIITKEEYDEVLNSNNKFADMFNYDSFKDGYDIINDTYELASYTLNGETVTNVEIRLYDNKLKDIYYTDSQGHIVNYHFY